MFSGVVCDGSFPQRGTEMAEAVRPRREGTGAERTVLELDSSDLERGKGGRSWRPHDGTGWETPRSQ